MSAPASHGTDHHEGHRPTWFYIAIAIFLAAITTFELGPLFGFYRLPPLALILLSTVKFFTVVAFFMHLWDDAPIYTRLFAAPLIGATLMVAVLMTLFHTFAPSPDQDPFAVQERYGDVWNGQCSSWLRSHSSNRWYCASPSVNSDRVKNEMLALAAAKSGGGEVSAPQVDLDAMSEAARKEWLVNRGKEVYETTCAACHQATGQGLPNVFPPLAKSDYMGDAKNHARIIVKGLSGEIVVNGMTYNGAMPAQQLADIDVAAVATYERNSWGNDLGVVLPADVAAVR